MATVIIIVMIQLLQWVCVFLRLYKHCLLNKVILKGFLCFDFHLVTFLTYKRLSHDAVKFGSKIGNSGGFISSISSPRFFQLLRGLYRWRRSSPQPSPVLLDLQVSCSPTARLRFWASENVGPETGMEKAAGLQRLSRNRDEDDDVKLLLYSRKTYWR